MDNLYNAFIRMIRYYLQTHNGCLPAKIIFQSQVLNQLKLPAWISNIPKDINDEMSTAWKFIEPELLVLHHEKCCVCGLVRDVIEFEHELDEKPVCNHCFKKMFVKDDKWEKTVKEQNDATKNYMPADYLDVYGELLFEEQSTQS